MKMENFISHCKNCNSDNIIDKKQIEQWFEQKQKEIKKQQMNELFEEQLKRKICPECGEPFDQVFHEQPLSGNKYPDVQFYLYCSKCYLSYNGWFYQKKIRPSKLEVLVDIGKQYEETFGKINDISPTTIDDCVAIFSKMADTDGVLSQCRPSKELLLQYAEYIANPVTFGTWNYMRQIGEDVIINV